MIERLDFTLDMFIHTKSLQSEKVIPTDGIQLSKTISNDQELIQSDSIFCPQNRKGNN